MKKFFAIVLALALVCSFGVAAFAAGSPTSSNPVEEYVEAAAEEAVSPFAYEGNEVPAEAIVMLSVDEAAEKLEGEEKEAFLAAYEDAKAIEGKVVVDFFWLALANEEEYTVNAENPLYFTFDCEGENVGVQVNGKDMAVTDNGGNSYTAALTELGAVAILCDAE